MVAVGVVGSAPLSTVSSHRRRSALLRSQHLSALQASSPFSLALGSCIHGGVMRAESPRRRRSNARIFLPHLVAAMEQVEETYVMVKPDGVQRGLVGEIVSRFEKKGFLLKGLKLFQCQTELAEDVVLPDLSMPESPVQIVDRKIQQLRNKQIELVKILWQNRQGGEATWELADEMRKRHSHLFE